MIATDIARLPIHFDVTAHYLTAADYLVAVKSFKTVLEDFNKRIFDGAIEYEFLVLPAEDGSYKGVCGVLVKGVKSTAKTVLTVGALGAVLGLADNSILNDFTKELTGKTIQEVHIGKELAIFLRDMTTGFYSTASDTLERIIPHDLNLDKAMFAKTEFYTMCIDNRDISAIGFDDTDTFPFNALHLHSIFQKIRYALYHLSLFYIATPLLFHLSTLILIEFGDLKILQLRIQ